MDCPYSFEWMILKRSAVQCAAFRILTAPSTDISTPIVFKPFIESLLRKRTSPAASEIVFAMCDAVACRDSKLDRELRILLLSHFRKRGILVQALHALALGLVSSYVLLLH